MRSGKSDVYALNEMPRLDDRMAVSSVIVNQVRLFITWPHRVLLPVVLLVICGSTFMQIPPKNFVSMSYCKNLTN